MENDSQTDFDPNLAKLCMSPSFGRARTFSDLSKTDGASVVDKQDSFESHEQSAAESETESNLRDSQCSGESSKHFLFVNRTPAKHRDIFRPLRLRQLSHSYSVVLNKRGVIFRGGSSKFLADSKRGVLTAPEF